MESKDRARNLAMKLREARRRAGLSQIESAARLHKPQSYVSRCESGARRIDIFELEAFAQVYGKPLTFFVANLTLTRSENK